MNLEQEKACKHESRERTNLGPWFRVQGLTNLEQVADYIVSLQRDNARLQARIDALTKIRGETTSALAGG
jgi:hypothetical protein